LNRNHDLGLKRIQKSNAANCHITSHSHYTRHSTQIHASKSPTSATRQITQKNTKMQHMRIAEITDGHAYKTRKKSVQANKAKQKTHFHKQSHIDCNLQVLCKFCVHPYRKVEVCLIPVINQMPTAMNGTNVTKFKENYVSVHVHNNAL